MLLKWGYNNALVHEVWAQWAFLLLKCRYGTKDLSEADTLLCSGLLQTERKHKEYFMVEVYLPVEVHIRHNTPFSVLLKPS